MEYLSYHLGHHRHLQHTSCLPTTDNPRATTKPNRTKMSVKMTIEKTSMKVSRTTARKLRMAWLTASSEKDFKVKEIDIILENVNIGSSTPSFAKRAPFKRATPTTDVPMKLSPFQIAQSKRSPFQMVPSKRSPFFKDPFIEFTFNQF